MNKNYNSIFALTLIMLLCSLGCQKKSSDAYNPYTIVEEAEVETSAEDIQSEISETITNHTVLLSSLLSRAFAVVALHPGLDSLQGPSVETRACPDVTFTTSSAMGTFPKVIEVSFSNCTPGASFDHSYNGTIQVTVTGPLNTTGTDVIIETITSAFTITSNNGGGAGTTYSINQGVRIDADYFDSSGGGTVHNYDYSVTNAVTVTEGTRQTTYPVGLDGRINFITVGADPNDPSTFVNQTFGVDFPGENLTCSVDGGMTTSQACTQISPPLVFNPFTCGCPQSGRVYVRADGMACSTGLSTSNSDEYNIRSSSDCVNGANANACDNDVCVTPLSTGVTTAMKINSCGT